MAFIAFPLAVIIKNALRRGHVGVNPSAYSLIVIRCRKSYGAKVVIFIEQCKFLRKKVANLAKTRLVITNMR